MNPIVVHRRRTVRVPIHLGYSVLGDVVTSQIREGIHPNSVLIATWQVNVSTDGRTIFLTLDDSVTTNIAHRSGYMDLKRITGGEPVNILEFPIPVVFQDVVTV